MARKDVSTLRDEATVAVEKGKFRQALELYVELEQRQPTDPAWPKRIGEVHRRLGSIPDAVIAFDRAIDRYVGAGFLVQAIAVCKLILQIDPAHRATLEKLAEMASKSRQPAAATTLPSRGRKPASPPSAPPPPPTPASPPPEPAAAQIHDRPPRMSRPYPRVTIPPGCGLDTLSLSSVVPGAKRLDNADGTASGIILIPLDEAELELELIEEPEDGHDAIDAAIGELSLPDEPLLTAARPSPPPSAALDLEARRALLTTPLLAGLPPRVLETLVHKLALLELARGDVLFSEGDPGACLYIVSEGTVVVESAAGELARLGPGAFFGEIALITDLPRSATIRAATPLELLAIDRDVIRDLIDQYPDVLGVLLRFVRDRLIDRVTRTSELFQPFSEDERRALSARFELVEVDPGTPLIVEGQRVDGLYVVLAGRVEVWRDGQAARVASLGPGEVFGEMSLLAGGGSTAHVRAATRALALRMPAKTFREVIMTHPQVLAYVGDLAARRSGPTETADDLVDLRLELL